MVNEQQPSETQQVTETEQTSRTQPPSDSNGNENNTTTNSHDDVNGNINGAGQVYVIPGCQVNNEQHQRGHQPQPTPQILVLPYMPYSTRKTA